MAEIGVLMTCHNRRDRTLACLRALRSASVHAGVSVAVHLVDDGSTDGTADAVQKEFDEVRLIRGDGSLYWNHGMRRAFQAACQVGYPMYLWLNDDTILDEGSMELLLHTRMELETSGRRLAIIAGATQDPKTLEQTYGGVVHSGRWHPLHLRLVEPGTSPLPCDSFFGNCVLVPHDVVDLVGNLDPIFSHTFGDIDYGFRARNLGCTIWTPPGYVGMCPRNSIEGTWEDRSLRARERFRLAQTPKGLPPNEWKVVLRRQSPKLWPLYLTMPYVKIALQSLSRRRPKAR